MSKGIGCGHSINAYRGFVYISVPGYWSRSIGQCESMLIGAKALSVTKPCIVSLCVNMAVEHEASTSKIGAEKLYLARGLGLGEDLSSRVILAGFCRDVFKSLPCEFASQVESLLRLNRGLFI